MRGRCCRVLCFGLWFTFGCGGKAVIDSDPGQDATGQDATSSSGGGFQTSCYPAGEAISSSDALAMAASVPLPDGAELVSVRSSNKGELDRCGKGRLWEFYFGGELFIMVGPSGVIETQVWEKPCNDAISLVDSALLVPDAAARVREADPTPAIQDGYTAYFLEQASLCGAHGHRIVDHPLVVVYRQWPENPGLSNPLQADYRFFVHYARDGSFLKQCGPCMDGDACSC